MLLLPVCTSVAALLSCAWQTQCEDVEDAGGGKEGETLSLEGWDPPAEAAAFLRAVAPAMLAQLEANAASHAFDGGGVARVRNVCVCVRDCAGASPASVAANAAWLQLRACIFGCHAFVCVHAYESVHMGEKLHGVSDGMRRI